MDNLLPEMIEPVEEPKPVIESEGITDVQLNDDHVDMIERERVEPGEVFKNSIVKDEPKSENPIVLKVESGLSITQHGDNNDVPQEEIEEIIQRPPKVRKKRVVTEAQKAHLAKAFLKRFLEFWRITITIRHIVTYRTLLTVILTKPSFLKAVIKSL